MRERIFRSVRLAGAVAADDADELAAAATSKETSRSAQITLSRRALPSPIAATREATLRVVVGAQRAMASRSVPPDSSRGRARTASRDPRRG